MSGVLSRTLHYLHSAAGEAGPGWTVPTAELRHSLSPGLAGWLHQVSSCLDRDQERRLVTRQVDLVTERLKQKSVSPGVASDCMVRLLYIYLLGYDVSPALSHSVKLAGASNILARKMGYLASSLMIPSSDRLLLLLTNSIIRDISSTNIVDIQLGLVAAANIINPAMIELVPLLVSRACGLVRHSSHLVRSKSLTLLDWLCQLDPGHWPAVCTEIIPCLEDVNPGVVIFAVQVLSRHLTDVDGDNVKLVVTAVVNLQLSIAEGSGLPSDYQYKGYNVPHLQVYCVRLYGAVSSSISADPELSDSVVSLLQSLLNTHQGCKELIILALVYEVVVTVSSIETAHCLLPLCLRTMSSFVSSRHSTTVYSGLCGLERIFRVRSPGATTREQEAAVLACLAHPDTNIQRRAAQIILLLASRENVVSIVDRVLAHVSRSRSRADYMALMERLVIILEKYADTVDCDWKANTFLKIIQVSKHRQRDLMMERLKFLLSSSSSEEGDAATVLELNRVRLKLRSLLGDIRTSRLSSGRPVPPAVISLDVWCEVHFSAEEVEEVVRKVVETGRQYREHVMVVQHCITGLQSLIMRHGPDGLGAAAVQYLQESLSHEDEKVRQAAEQCLAVREDWSSSQQCQVPSKLDFSLSFLDNHVVQSLSSGAATFIPRPPCQPSGTALITSTYSVSLSEDSPATLTRVTAPRSVWTDEGRLELEKDEEELGQETRTSEMEDLSATLPDEPSLNSVNTLDDDWD